MNVSLTSLTTNCCWLRLGPIQVLFSYTTPIALVTNDGTRVRRRSAAWITGRHINAAGVRHYPELDEKTFDEQLNKAVMLTGMQQFKEQLGD